MNGTEQRKHRTATAELADAIETLAKAADARADALEGALAYEQKRSRKLEEEQRGYVDARDRELCECCQERWDESSAATKRLGDRIADLRNRGFWSRLNWFLTGR